MRTPLQVILREPGEFEPQQLYPFLALSLHERASLKEVAEQYWRLLSSGATPSLNIANHQTCTPRATFPDLEELFTIDELKAAISDTNKRSTPGHDGVSYPALANLSPTSRLRLLEYYNASWINGEVPKDSC